MAIPFETHRAWVVDAPIVTDAHGNRSRSSRDWDNATVVAADVPVCKQPDAATLGASLATDEDTGGGREQVTETSMFHFNPGTPVKATHGIRVGSPAGTLYLINGQPQVMSDPLGGGLEHIAVKAERTWG